MTTFPRVARDGKCTVSKKLWLVKLLQKSSRFCRPGNFTNFTCKIMCVPIHFYSTLCELSLTIICKPTLRLTFFHLLIIFNWHNTFILRNPISTISNTWIFAPKSPCSKSKTLHSQRPDSYTDRQATQFLDRKSKTFAGKTFAKY